MGIAGTAVRIRGIECEGMQFVSQSKKLAACSTQWIGSFLGPRMAVQRESYMSYGTAHCVGSFHELISSSCNVSYREATVELLLIRLVEAYVAMA